MSNHLVIDTSVYLTYIGFNKIDKLYYVIDKYGLNVYVNDTLLDEIQRNILKVLRNKSIDPILVFNIIKDFIIQVNTNSIFTESPYPKDNFLFDLAIQTNSEIIVTQEKALLSFHNSPVAIHNIKWVKETYPVD